MPTMTNQVVDSKKILLHALKNMDSLHADLLQISKGGCIVEWLTHFKFKTYITINISNGASHQCGNAPISPYFT